MAKHLSVESPSADNEIQAKGRKPRRHAIYDHKLLTVFVVPLLFVALVNVIVIAMHAKLDISPTGADSLLPLSIASIATALVLYFLFYRLRLWGEFDGVLGWSTTGLLFGLPTIGFVISNLQDVWPAGLGEINPIPIALIAALAPGIGEEIIFRGIPGSNWMRVRAEPRDIFSGVIVTSLVFGVVHGGNLAAGAALSSTLFQMFYAFCLGVLFDAILLRTGSLLPSIILHTLIDFSAFLVMDLAETGTITEELTINLNFWITVGLSAFFVIWGFILLRPSKHAEIIALWNRKFHKEY